MRIEEGVQFVFEQALIYRVFLYLLAKVGSAATAKKLPWSLFVFLRMNFLLKGLESVLSHKRNNEKVQRRYHR